MTVELFVILLVAVFALVYLVVPPSAAALWRYRGKRIITCPETRKPAAVKVDSSHAAVTAIAGPPKLRLSACSRWPEREDCGQECLLEVELTPEDCLLQNILNRWYEDKHCVLCGRKFAHIQWLDHKPALFDYEGRTIEWNEVAPEQIPEALSSHYPVCWDCHITRTFCLKHPEMVVDRTHVSTGIHRAT